jgi:hypothetical protein
VLTKDVVIVQHNWQQTTSKRHKYLEVLHQRRHGCLRGEDKRVQNSKDRGAGCKSLKSIDQNVALRRVWIAGSGLKVANRDAPQKGRTRVDEAPHLVFSP